MSNQSKPSNALHFDDREHAWSVYQLAHAHRPAVLKGQWVLLLTWLLLCMFHPRLLPGLIEFLGPLGGITADVGNIYGAFVSLWSGGSVPEWVQRALTLSLTGLTFASALLSLISVLELISSTRAEYLVTNDDVRKRAEMPTEKFTAFVNEQINRYRVYTSSLGMAPTVLTFLMTGSFALAVLVLVVTLYSVSVQRNALDDIRARAEAPC